MSRSGPRNLQKPAPATSPSVAKLWSSTTKNCKIESVKKAAAEKGRTYGICSLNIADNAHAENDSVRIEENADGHDSK